MYVYGLRRSNLLPAEQMQINLLNTTFRLMQTAPKILSRRFHSVILFVFALLFTFHPIDVIGDSTKIPGPAETIQLGEEVFEIPEPWTGNKIVPPTIAPSVFRQIPTDHTQNGTSLYVTEQAHTALVQMLEAACEDGISLKVESGYRSSGYQKKIFLRMLDEGRTFDDIVRYVAPPGYSQHILGSAVDFYPSNWRFAKLPAYSWLQKNAATFGFSETYPKDNSLHYPWEAWHWNFEAQ